MPSVHLFGSRDSWARQAIPHGVACSGGDFSLSSRIASGDVVVIDLERAPAEITPLAARRSAEVCSVILISGRSPVATGWLELVADGKVRLVASNGKPSPGLLRQRLMELLGQPDSKALAYAILGANTRWFGTLEACVRLICENPSGIRRPSELADRSGIKFSVLRECCRAAGHVRVEHFITEVRTSLRDHLIRSKGLTISEASRRAGIMDMSNHRRQLNRARGLSMIILFLAALPVSACGGTPQADAAPADSVRERGDPVALPVVGSAVERADLVLTIRTTGRVRAERLVSVRSENHGSVTEVRVRAGDEVAAGAVLALLDPRPFDLAVREAEGALADARFRLSDLVIGDDLRDTSETARTRRENARQRSGVVGAEARLERAQLDRERAVLTAPFAGIIDELGIVTGQRVASGDFVARLVDLSTLVVEASVLEHDLSLLRRGGNALVMPNAGNGQSLSGTIAAVLPVIDSTTRAGRVLVRVTSYGSLRPGMYADVELESERLPRRVVVPAGAIIERDGRPLVFRVRGGKAEWVYVQAGRSNGRFTEIRADSASTQTAVAPGDTVLVEGHLTLTHDAPVRVTSLTRP